MLTLILALLILSYILNKKDQIIFKIDNILWSVFCFINLVSLIYTTNLSDGLRFVISIFVLIIIKIIFENDFKCQKRIMSVFFIFSLIHVLTTILYFIIPELIVIINRNILNTEQLAFNLEAFSRGESAGITGQTGTNAFYISVFNAIVFGKMITIKNQRLIYLLLYIIGIIALFMTVKRGPLLFNVIAIFIVIITMAIAEKRNLLKYFTVIFLLIIILFTVLTSLSSSNPIFYKWFNTNDVSNGRFDLFIITWEYFKESPLIGNGAQSTRILFNGGAPHNIYLQVLAELGLVGLICLLSIFIFTFFNTMKLIKNALSKADNKNLIATLVSSLYLQVYFISYGFTGNPLFDINFLLTYLIFVAMANVYLNREGKNRENRNVNIS
ncbi:O-antigen ligase family protein [Peribacillus simplex]|uniref:O-antigen ligase family protein n=1 Tax=Peribacillus simplex TaxID=1478 RepID=UPI0014301AD8|nr:O-antigen ligase family protein [Peribacillus simplex]